MYFKVMHLTMIIFLFLTASTSSASRFSSTPYSCVDGVKTCRSSGERVVNGIKVSRTCWEWSYVKTCNYPSKDDCKLYSHCYWMGDGQCFLKDAYGNCVNLEREFSCKRWEDVILQKDKVREVTPEMQGKRVVCKGIPCIDGNCFDKSYETNGEMMDSISKLYAASLMKPNADKSFNLFAGYATHCSKKTAEYTNCCAISGQKGWGSELGAKCNSAERELSDKRSKNLCLYIGKEQKKKAGVTSVVKHHFCCFGNLLDKAIQLAAHHQLGKSFGTPDNPNCGGLRIEEIQRLDFSRVDFSEFINEMQLKFSKSYKGARPNDIESRINNSTSNIRRGDNDELNRANNAGGWKENFIKQEGGGR